MKKSILVLTIALAMLLSMTSLFAQLKPIYQELYDFGGSWPGNVIYPTDDGTISYTTYVTSRPEDTQSGPHPLCTARMSSGRFLLAFNMGNFDNPWLAGDILRIEVLQTTTGRIVTTEFALEGGNLPQALFDGLSIVLQDPPTKLFSSNPPESHVIGTEGLIMAPGYPMNGVYRANGWGVGDDWNISFPTVGFENITLTSKLRRQYWFDDEDTFEDYWGPRLFRTYYSLDNGASWVQNPVANYTMPSVEADWLTIAFDLPEALWGQANVKIKWELFNANGISSDGWGEIKDVLVTGDGVFVPPTDHIISGMFSTVNWDLTNVVIEATAIPAGDITYNNVTGAYSITVPDAWTGTVTPTKAGFMIVPSFRDYTNVTADFENQDYVIKKDVNPNAPVITAPTAGQVFEWAAAQTVTATWTAPAGYAPEYYEVKFGATDWTSVNQDLTWTTPALGAGDYTFEVRGVIDTPMAKTYVPIRAKATDRSAGNSSRGTGNAASVNFEVIITVPVFNLTITSDPVGAAIMLGGVAIGEVTPVEVSVAGTYTVELDGYTFLPVEYVWDGMANAAIEFVGTLIPADYDVDPGVPAELDPETDVTITGGGFVGANLIVVGLTPVPNALFIPTSQGILQLVGTGLVTLTFDFDPAIDWFVYRTGGAWTAIAGPLTTYSVVVDLGSKDAPFEFKGGGGGDPTLPVELSVFNAVLTAQNFVKLSWISESETNMLGYRVYRAESANQAEALLITPIMIQATNTSTTQNYSIEDREVSTGNTYYYWLEAVDYSHSSFFGYRAVEVLGDVTPELPVQSAMKSAYPNPFRASSNTNIEVSVKAGETGTVTIYNVLGQVVKTYSVSEGNHNITWNARDSRGNICGSGIYFYKMSTPSMNQTKKMAIVK